MILNDVYILMNYVLRGTTATNIDKKISAINEGYKYLQQRMIEKGKGIEELLSTPTNIATTISINYVSLPTDFISLKEMFYQSGTNYIGFGLDASKTYRDLILQTGDRFFDTTDVGVPSMYSVKKPYIYFDHHFNASDTDYLKIIYHKRPATLVGYDRLTVTGASGVYTVGETITGSQTEETATVYAAGTGYIDVLTVSRTGLFMLQKH
jgi:hypothetical protein